MNSRNVSFLLNIILQLHYKRNKKHFHYILLYHLVSGVGKTVLYEISRW